MKLVQGALYRVGQKTAQFTLLGESSAKRWPITVKFGSTLAETFLNISADNYVNTWFKSNAIVVSFMHTDVTQ